MHLLPLRRTCGRIRLLPDVHELAAVDLDALARAELNQQRLGRRETAAVAQVQATVVPQLHNGALGQCSRRDRRNGFCREQRGAVVRRDRCT